MVSVSRKHFLIMPLRTHQITPFKMYNFLERDRTPCGEGTPPPTPYPSAPTAPRTRRLWRFGFDAFGVSVSSPASLFLNLGSSWWNKPWVALAIQIHSMHSTNSDWHFWHHICRGFFLRNVLELHNSCLLFSRLTENQRMQQLKNVCFSCTNTCL